MFARRQKDAWAEIWTRVVHCHFGCKQTFGNVRCPSPMARKAAVHLLDLTRIGPPLIPAVVIKRPARACGRVAVRSSRLRQEANGSGDGSDDEHCNGFVSVHVSRVSIGEGFSNISPRSSLLVSNHTEATINQRDEIGVFTQAHTFSIKSSIDSLGEISGRCSSKCLPRSSSAGSFIAFRLSELSRTLAGLFASNTQSIFISEPLSRLERSLTNLACKWPPFEHVGWLSWIRFSSRMVRLPESGTFSHH